MYTAEQYKSDLIAFKKGITDLHNNFNAIILSDYPNGNLFSNFMRELGMEIDHYNKSLNYLQFISRDPKNVAWDVDTARQLERFLIEPFGKLLQIWYVNIGLEHRYSELGVKLYELIKLHRVLSMQFTHIVDSILKDYFVRS